MNRKNLGNLKDLQRLHACNHRQDVMETRVSQDIMKGLRAHLEKRGYRADLKLVTASKNTEGSFHAEVKFRADLGFPAEQDLMAIVAQSYPQHQIEWETAEVDANAGIVLLNLNQSVECVPISSMKEIPSEFVSIGAGIYKRAADTTGQVMEIWKLKKDDAGSLALYRNHDDVEVTASDEEFRAGDVVNTPYGCGKITRFDDLGNAFVQIGNKMHLVAADEVQDYDINKERKALTDYYAQAVGDTDFANALTRSTEQILKDLKKSKESK